VNRYVVARVRARELVLYHTLVFMLELVFLIFLTTILSFSPYTTGFKHVQRWNVHGSDQSD
jgi:hypothetical protein